MWEAEMEAGLLKADSKYKAAAAAETRTRKLNDKLDLFDEEGEEVEAGIPPEHAATGEAERMLPLRVGLAPANKKTRALRYKFQ